MVSKKKVRALLALNSLSFCAARAYWHSNEGLGAKFEIYHPAEDGELMFYLVAGCINQPRTAFKFIMDELKEVGGVTLVTYRNTRGCSMATIAKQVVRDAEKHHYKVVTIGISIGDYVARVVEDTLPEAKSIPINPEPDSVILQPWARVASKIGSVLVSGLTIPLGWLSLIPWFNGDGNLFSVAFIADQFRDIGFVTNTPRTTSGVLGLIVSEYDEYLVNSIIRSRFPDVPIAVTPTKHGRTVPNAAEFLKAWRELNLQWKSEE